MPKLKNVTALDLARLFEKTEEALYDTFDINERIQKGYCDRIDDIHDFAKQAAILSEAFSTMTKQLLIRAQMQQREAELEELRKRAEEAGK